MVSIVYMVAGISARFQGRIKSFVPVYNNETLIEYSLNQALPAGFDKIIFIVGENTEQPFREKFGTSYHNIPVYYAFQNFDNKMRDRPWGTVDALCSVLPLIKQNEPFVVCNGDDIYGENSFKILYNHLINELKKQPNISNKNKKNNNENNYDNENKQKKECENATLGYKLENVLPEKGDVNRGIFKIKQESNQDYVTKIEEIFNINRSNLKEKNLNLESLCSMNIFALFPETLEKLNSILIEFKKKHKNERKIECLLPVELSNLIQAGKIKMKIYPTKDRWYGITNPEDEFIVREILKESSQRLG